MNDIQRKDDRLHQFLKANEPIAPESPAFERAQILNKIRTSDARPRSVHFFGRLSWAAGLVLVALALFSVLKNNGVRDEASREEVVTVYYDALENSGVEAENGEDFVGNDYVQLAAAISE